MHKHTDNANVNRAHTWNENQMQKSNEEIFFLFATHNFMKIKIRKKKKILYARIRTSALHIRVCQPVCILYIMLCKCVLVCGNITPYKSKIICLMCNPICIYVFADKTKIFMYFVHLNTNIIYVRSTMCTVSASAAPSPSYHHQYHIYLHIN